MKSLQFQSLFLSFLSIRLSLIHQLNAMRKKPVVLCSWLFNFVVDIDKHTHIFIHMLRLPCSSHLWFNKRYTYLFTIPYLKMNVNQYGKYWHASQIKKESVAYGDSLLIYFIRLLKHLTVRCLFDRTVYFTYSADESFYFSNKIYHETLNKIDSG